MLEERDRRSKTMAALFVVITLCVATLIQARTRDHLRASFFLVLLLPCILVGLAACVEEPGSSIPSGPPSYNLPTPTISGPNPFQTGTPCSPLALARKPG